MVHRRGVPVERLVERNAVIFRAIGLHLLFPKLLGLFRTIVDGYPAPLIPRARFIAAGDEWRQDTVVIGYWPQRASASKAVSARSRQKLRPKVEGATPRLAGVDGSAVPSSALSSELSASSSKGDRKSTRLNSSHAN